MAEEFARNRQYEYRANSNLVLEADRETRRRTDEPTGEVESLWGRMGAQRMGDKVRGGRAPDGDERARRARASREKRRRGDAEDLATQKRRRRGDGGEDGADGGYRPRTKEARAAYEAILADVRAALGDAPRDVLAGAAEEALHVLKRDGVRDADRHAELERLLGARVPDERFAALVARGKRVTDFDAGGAGAGAGGDDAGGLDEEMGVAVVFDEDESDDEAQDVDEVHSEEEDDDAARGVEAARDGKLLTGVGDDAAAAAGAAGADGAAPLDVHAVDAHWLQRGISAFVEDANASALLARDVLAALGPDGGDERACETRLVMLLDYDRFDFIKTLLANRSRVFYCTRLKQAQTEAEAEAVRAQMAADVDGGGAAILEALAQTGSAETWAQDRAADFANRTRREAVGLSKLRGVQLDDGGR